MGEAQRHRFVAAPSSPSASSRPSKPAPAPPRWSSVSTASTSTMATGMRLSPDVFLLSRARGGGWPWRARMDRKGHAKVRRKLIIQTRPREPDACYANHCFFRVLSPVETFCVNGRAHATARRRFLSHFPGNDEPRVGAFAYDCAPTSSIRGRGTTRQMRALTRRAGRSGSASASRHRQRAQQAQHAGASEDASHVGARASQLLRRGS